MLCNIISLSLLVGLPDPEKTQGLLQELSTMLEEKPALRESLARASDVNLSCQDVMKAKVS